MKKNIIKRIVAAVSVVACSLCLTATPVATVPVEAATGNEGISTCAEILEWVYAEKDGVMYKRLLNCSTGQWVGDWIFVRYL